MKDTLITIAFALFFSASVSGQITAIKPTTPEQSGDENVAAGKYAAAIDQYKTAWLGWLIGRNEADADLRSAHERIAGKMGAALAKMTSPPVPSEDADFHAQKGAAFVKLAKTPLDFLKAASQFQEAVNGAPWVFDYHFNLAVAYKSAGQFRDALYSLSLAKLLAANEKDRRDANALRAEIEAAQEMAASVKAEAEKQDAVKAREQRILGDWRRPQALSDGVPRMEILHLRKDSAGNWKLTYDYGVGGNWSRDLSYGEMDLAITGDSISFRVFETMQGETCATYRVSGTVSGDGNRLPLAYDLEPFSAEYSNYRYCLKSNYGSHSRPFIR